MSDKNEDYRPPETSTYEFGPVIRESHEDPEQLPIYWGPQQLLPSDGEYVVPDPEAWRGHEFLNIPKVVRFIYCTKSTYDTEDYPEDDGGGGGGGEDYYQISRLAYREPPFLTQFIVYIDLFVNDIFIMTTFFSTQKFIIDPESGNLIDVGSTLNVGDRFRGYPGFGWLQTGVDGPGWYHYVTGNKVNFF